MIKIIVTDITHVKNFLCFFFPAIYRVSPIPLYPLKKNQSIDLNILCGYDILTSENNQGHYVILRMEMRLKKRRILPDILKWIDRDEIIVLIGSRQVGKTSLIHLILEELKEKQKFYFDLEDIDIFNNVNSGPKAFVKYLEYRGADINNKVYVAIDEIQYLKDPSNFLKIIHDHFPQIKLIVSGSSSFEIKRKFKDSLAGRKKIFEIETLNFEEFLSFRNEKLYDIKMRIGGIERVFKGDFDNSTGLLEKDFSAYLDEYLFTGGYPKAAMTGDLNLKKEIIKEIYNSYIRKDIKDMGNIEDIIGFNRLLVSLSNQTANLLNLHNMSKVSQLSLNTIKKYIFLLENTFIVTLLRPFFKNMKKELSKMPRVFINDTGLRNISVNNLRIDRFREDTGRLLENLVFLQLKKRFSPNEDLYFWRTQAGAEVDFVIKQEEKLIPVEVKAIPMKKPAVSRSLRSFIEQYNPEMGIIINFSLAMKDKIGKTTIYFLPVYAI